MNVVTRSLLVGVALIGSMVEARANLMVNGGFEAPVVPVGSFTNFSLGSALLTGWTVFGPAGTGVSVVSGSFSQGGVSFVAQEGSQWLDLTGFNANSTEGVSQAVATIPGHEYELSFFIGNTTGGGIFGSSSTVNVTLNGALAFSDTNSAVSATTQVWAQFTHHFVPSTALTIIGFANGDPASDNDNGLDNIILLDLGPTTQPPTSVPEPTTLALLGAGLFAISRLRRNRGR